MISIRGFFHEEPVLTLTGGIVIRVSLYYLPESQA